jgi:hypothetical protein
VVVGAAVVIAVVVTATAVPFAVYGFGIVYHGSDSEFTPSHCTLNENAPGLDGVMVTLNVPEPPIAKNPTLPLPPPVQLETGVI